MGLFSGPRAGAGPQAARDWGVYPVIPPNSMVGAVAPSFTNVSTHDAESAMRQIACQASVELISSLVAQLPRDVITGNGPDRRPVPGPVFLDDPDGTGHGFGDWCQQLLYSLLLRGNAVGRVLARDAAARPSQILLAHPDSVGLHERADGPHWYFDGKEWPADDVWHMRAFPVPGRRLGMSVIARHAVQIGQGLAAGSFGLRWFVDGAHPSAIFQHEDAELDEADAATIKTRFLQAMRGAREPLVYGKGWHYQQIQVAANESQFLDTQRFSEAQCARMFGPNIAEVLGYETGGSMTYANVEQRAVDLLKFSLNKWLVRIEDRISRDILARPRTLKFNRAAILQTDLKSRYEAYAIGLANKFRYVNEVRALEDLPPVEWGDKPSENKMSPAEVVQKAYLGVGKILTADEARELVNEAGADLPVPGPEFPPAAQAVPAVPASEGA